MPVDHQQALRESRALIGESVRELRLSRRWSQRELAEQLGLSQNRLSEIERGGGSFTAEQLLLILRLFNVEVGVFEPSRSIATGELQNALIRYGATHLRQVPATAPGHYQSAADVIAAVLLNPYSERFLTALAPVLLRSCDEIPLPVLQSDLVQAGRPNRLGWLAENVERAIGAVQIKKDAASRRTASRAAVVLGEFLQHLEPNRRHADSARDTLDRGIRTKRSLQRTWERASDISQKWLIVSALQVDDFADALRQANERD